MEKYKFKGFSINTIKVIAILTMLVDHIAVYFEYAFIPQIYIICRAIGRIAMPLFVYSLVQGYIHTSSLKKYIFRLGILGIITQILIYLMSVINDRYFSNYICYVDELVNIVISFTLTLILIKAIDFKNKYIDNINKYINFILRLIIITIVVVIYYFVNMDYKFTVPFLAINFFIFERLKQKYKNKTIFLSSIEYIFMFIISVLYNSLEVFVVFDIIILLLYNGKKKNNLEINRTFEYLFFPLHHTILYFVAMVIRETL